MKNLVIAFIAICFSCNSVSTSKYPSKFEQKINEKPFSLVVSYSIDCPVAQLYTSVLREIISNLPSDSFQCLLLKVNASENWDISENKFQIMDQDALKIAKVIGFTVFPEVAILDAKGKVLYKGAIDGRVKEIGNTHFQPLPSEMYLKSALTQIRKHQKNEIPSTQAKGCFIEFDKKQ